MYKITKKMVVAGAHKLCLPYESACQNLHGHNWVITVTLSSDKLTKYGMVMDFKHIKNRIEKQLDHKNLNDVFNFNPTAENMAIMFKENLQKDLHEIASKNKFDNFIKVCSVRVHETVSSFAEV